MKYFRIVLLVALAACGGSDITAPVTDPLPTDLRPGDGVLRFTLSPNCPTLTVAFGVDIFWYGPETLTPGKSQDYRQPQGTYVTSGRAFPVATITFSKENTTVVAGQRVVRLLAC